MRVSVQDRLLRALSRRDIPFHIQREVVNEVFVLRSPIRDELRREASFASLISAVVAAKRTVMGNKTKWHPALVTLYEEYVALLTQTHDTMVHMQNMMVPNPEDPHGARVPATLAIITALAKRKNDKCARDGLPPLPSCTAAWPTWVAPADKTRLIEAFDTAYARMGRGRGKRFIPFHTTALAHSMGRAVLRHRKFIDDMRAATCDRPDGKGSTHYRALHLCALRMAELWLDNYEKDIRLKHRHPATDPVPVNWTHMLTSDMRQRVAAADANPTDYIDPTGLGSFLDEPEA